MIPRLRHYAPPICYALAAVAGALMMWEAALGMWSHAMVTAVVAVACGAVGIWIDEGWL